MKHSIFEDNSADLEIEAMYQSKSINGNSFTDFLVNKPMYSKYEITENNLHDIIDVMNGEVKLETYCPMCGNKRIFYMKKLPTPYLGNETDGYFNPGYLSNDLNIYLELKETARKNGNEVTSDWFSFGKNSINCRVVDFPFKCSLDKNHTLDYIIHFSGNEAIKIGQWPSFADLRKSDLKKYKKIIPEEYLTELKRAVGLASDEIGIGAYVYFRRVIEYLVNTAGKKAISDGKFTEKNFEFDGNRRRKVAEKIKLLKGYLPGFMIQNASVYGIVSKGIHELSEDECRKYFDVLYESVIEILDDLYAEKQKEENQDRLTKAISRINSEVEKND